MSSESQGVRINKYLADKGLCSRREAETLILNGWVKVNGKVLTELSFRVSKDDRVTLDEKVETFLGQKQTVIINKPVGYVSGQAEEDYKPAIRLITPENYAGPKKPNNFSHKGFAPAGRLDIDSTGLLILTQNGKIAKKLIAPDSKIEKEYVIRVEGEITHKKIDTLCFGLSLDGRKLKRAKVSRSDEDKLIFILTEGRKRQIRRMCELVDLNVVALTRVRIGGLQLGTLPLGQWRFLKKTDKI